jgi:ketol-acid reductoisomerase
VDVRWRVAGSRGWRAVDSGFGPDPFGAVRGDVIMILVPDLVQPDLFKQDCAAPDRARC